MNMAIRVQLESFIDTHKFALRESGDCNSRGGSNGWTSDMFPSKSMFCPRYFVLTHTICLKDLFCKVVFTSLGCY